MLPRRSLHGLGLLLGSAILAVPTLARAAEPGPDTLPLSVVTIQTSDADEQADSLTKALRSAVRAMPGWSVADGDFSLEVITLQLKCEPSDATCASRIADQIHADRYVWGTLKKKGSTVSGDLHFWVRGKGSTSVPVSYPSNLVEANDEALKKIATDAIVQLTGGPPKGNIHVKAGTIDGQVFVDGAPIGALAGGEGTFLIASGSRKITVKAAGYADVETTIVVKPNATSDVSLSPVKGTPGGPTDVKRIIGFASLGTGVVLATIGFVGLFTVNGVRGDPLLNDYRNGPGAGQDDFCAYAKDHADATFTSGMPAQTHSASEVKDLCAKAGTWEAVQAVTFPLAAIAGGAGIYLLMTSGHEKPKDSASRSWQVTPQISPRAGRVDVTVRF